MQEVFSKIIEKLEEYEYENLVERDSEQSQHCKDIGDCEGMDCSLCVFNKAIEIVKQEAEKFGTDTNVGSNGWIPCSVRLPDEAFGCLVTVMDCNPSTQTEFENILPYFVGYDGETWNDADGEEIPFEVVAWRKLPTPYQPKGE